VANICVADCSGIAEAGLKWLRRAGFGTTNTNVDGVSLLKKLKLAYDPRIRYSTFQYTITPELAKRLPIPGGYDDTGALYACVPDGRVEPKSLYMVRFEGDTRTDLLMLFSSKMTFTHQNFHFPHPLYSSALLWNPRRH